MKFFIVAKGVVSGEPNIQRQSRCFTAQERNWSVELDLIGQLIIAERICSADLELILIFIKSDD